MKRFMMAILAADPAPAVQFTFVLLLALGVILGLAGLADVLSDPATLWVAGLLVVPMVGFAALAVASTIYRTFVR